MKSSLTPTRKGSKRLKALWRRERAFGETELPLRAWARTRPDGQEWLARKRTGR